MTNYFDLEFYVKSHLRLDSANPPLDGWMDIWFATITPLPHSSSVLSGGKEKPPSTQQVESVSPRSPYLQIHSILLVHGHCQHMYFLLIASLRVDSCKVSGSKLESWLAFVLEYTIGVRLSQSQFQTLQELKTLCRCCYPLSLSPRERLRLTGTSGCSRKGLFTEIKIFA